MDLLRKADQLANFKMNYDDVDHRNLINIKHQVFIRHRLNTFLENKLKQIKLIDKDEVLTIEYNGKTYDFKNTDEISATSQLLYFVKSQTLTDMKNSKNPLDKVYALFEVNHQVLASITSRASYGRNIEYVGERVTDRLQNGPFRYSFYAGDGPRIEASPVSVFKIDYRNDVLDKYYVKDITEGDLISGQNRYTTRGIQLPDTSDQFFEDLPNEVKAKLLILTEHYSNVGDLKSTTMSNVLDSFKKFFEKTLKVLKNMESIDPNKADQYIGDVYIGIKQIPGEELGQLAGTKGGYARRDVFIDNIEWLHNYVFDQAKLSPSNLQTIARLARNMLIFWLQ